MDTDEDALNVETLKRTAKVAGHRLKVANWGKGKIIRGKIIEGIANLRFEISKLKICTENLIDSSTVPQSRKQSVKRTDKDVASCRLKVASCEALDRSVPGRPE
jgi:hypothetical protein